MTRTIQAQILTLGVEEEFFVVEPTTRALVPDAQAILDRLAAQGLAAGKNSSYDHEFQLSMIESRTRVCQSLREVRTELQQLRSALIRAAADTGRWIMAAGTAPLADLEAQAITPNPRYQQIAQMHPQAARDYITCACQVHIGITDREIAVQVLNRVRPWLPALLALSASSPFCMGRDTGYASYRSMIWTRWPSAGTPNLYRSAAEYGDVVQSLIDTGTILDPGQIYWDVRLGNGHDTLEFRIADAATTIDEAVLQAGLCRALARICLDQAISGRPLPEIRPELLGAARWRAARFGLEDSLVDVLKAQPVPASALLDRFLAYLRPALEDAGDWDEVFELVEGTRRRGTSAHRQRRTFAQTQSLRAVVDMLSDETAAGCCLPDAMNAARTP